MKGKRFLILLVAVGVLVAVSFLRFGGKPEQGEVKMGDKLFIDLPVNQVATVTISDGESTVTLVKGDPVWQVKERSGYPANFSELSDLVRKLSRLKIGRRFDGSPESLARLSLMDPSTADTATRGKKITLKDESGKTIAGVILGRTRDTDSGGSGGQYLIQVGSDAVFLVDGSFQSLKTTPSQWLMKEILNIKAETVASVTCYERASTTPVYTLSRPERGNPVEMIPVSKGRNADSAKVDQVFDALAPLTLEDVHTVEGNPPAVGSTPFRLVYRLYDGRQISIFPNSDGKDKYTVRVAVEELKDESALSPAPEKKAGEDSQSEENKNDQGAPDIKTAQQLNDELSPWVFLVKKWQYDSLITQVESLLEEPTKKKESSS